MSDRPMGGNYPPGLTHAEFDRHTDSPNICHGCEEVFCEDDLIWDRVLDQVFCSVCYDKAGEEEEGEAEE